MGRPLIVGDMVLLEDSKRRRHMITLTEEGEFHTHTGVVPHRALRNRRTPSARRPMTVACACPS